MAGKEKKMKIYSWVSVLNETGNPSIRKANAFDVDGRRTYNTPEDVARFVYDGLELHNFAEEYTFVLCFSAKMHLLGCFEVSHGTVTGSYLNPREVFQKALMLGAVNIMVTHNHPSGDPTPSKSDYETTKRLVQAGNIIGVPLLDHIVVGRHGYYSMTEHGIIREGMWVDSD